MNLKQLPSPSHFDPDKVGEVWQVPYLDRAKQAKEWKTQHQITNSNQDEKRICLLLMDVQNTFCIPGFELFVGGRSGKGAVEDNARLVEFIYKNLSNITTITPTMDTHSAIQIFHPIFLVDQNNNHPDPMTIVTYEEVVQGKWKVNPAIVSGKEDEYNYLQNHLLHYTKKLSDSGKYSLIIWPYHSMLGGIGHALVSSVEEAIFYHTIARNSHANIEIKGSNPLTENYSVLSPEVTQGHDRQPIADKNNILIENLVEYDIIVIAGQAKSHCVAWTIDDLLQEMKAKNKDLGKVYLLEDCTSPVVVPDVIDFTDMANEAFDRFAQEGMNLVKSTDPMESWKNFPL